MNQRVISWLQVSLISSKATQVQLDGDSDILAARKPFSEHEMHQTVQGLTRQAHHALSLENEAIGWPGSTSIAIFGDEFCLAVYSLPIELIGG